jgi:hypothetical protein
MLVLKSAFCCSPRLCIGGLSTMSRKARPVGEALARDISIAVQGEGKW